jgi:hypothetical protein
MCDVCSKAFSHKHNLLDHQRLHLGLVSSFKDIVQPKKRGSKGVPFEPL